MPQIGFISVGNMGYPMLLGAVKTFSKTEVTFYDVSMERMEEIQKETGVTFSESMEELVANCKYVVLTIKPQFYQQVLDKIKDIVKPETIVITVAPGITTSDMKYSLGEDVKVVRTMPNTPALIGEGMTGISFSSDNFTKEEEEQVFLLFSSFGKYEVFDEKLMDAVVCANGSSPAYVYMFIEALADSVVKYGIPRDKAYTLTAQTVLGAAKMVLETKEHPGLLKDRVCSPGGTTIEGVAALEEYGMRNAIMKATDACYEKAISFKK